MSLEKIDILFKFLEQNNALDIDVPERFRCKKCIKLLRNSCQVQCGCRYCLNCVNDMILNGQLVCHGLDEDCVYGDLSNVSKDFIFNKEISKLVVKCPSKKCFHECELRDLYEHIRNCVKMNVDCLFNKTKCNEMTMHSNSIIEHRQRQIQNRTNMSTEMMERFENKFNQNIAENENESNILKQQVISRYNESPPPPYTPPNPYQYLPPSQQQQQQHYHHNTGVLPLLPSYSHFQPQQQQFYHQNMRVYPPQNFEQFQHQQQQYYYQNMNVYPPQHQQQPQKEQSMQSLQKVQQKIASEQMINPAAQEKFQNSNTKYMSDSVGIAHLQPNPHDVMRVRNANDEPWAPAQYISKVVTLFEYQQNMADELSFKENELIFVVKKNKDGWWEGVMKGRAGLFPGNYVQNVN